MYELVHCTISPPTAAPLEYKLSESRGLVLRFEGCPTGAWNTALHIVGLKNSLTELIHLLKLGLKPKRIKHNPPPLRLSHYIRREGSKLFL